jgi:hypothetical protein
MRVAAVPVAGLIVVLALAALVGLTLAGTRDASRANSVAEERAAVGALEESIRAEAVASRTFDISSFAQIFVDDPAVPLTDTQKETVARLSPGTQPAGYLTFMRAYFTHWQKGAEYANKVQAALQAGQKPDPNDVRAAIPPRQDAIVMPVLKLVKFELTSPDRAYLEVDTDYSLYQVKLVKQGDRWLIAGETRINH